VVGESDEKVVGEKGMEETIETSIMMLRSAMGAVIL
jgi:hypothetical protein